MGLNDVTAWCYVIMLCCNKFHPWFNVNFLSFKHIDVKNTVKVHRFLTGFSQDLSQVFSQGKNSQGFSQGFAWVLTL